MTTDEINQGESKLIRSDDSFVAQLIRRASILLEHPERSMPGYFLLITVVGVAIADAIAMSAIYFIRHWPYHLQVLLDSVIMTVIIFPLLYFLSFKPLLVQFRQRARSENIMKARLHVMQYATRHMLADLLEFSLNEIESLIGSKIGFFHLLDEDQKTISMQAWSTRTVQSQCKAESENSHNDLERAGVWADAARHRKPIIHNNYARIAHRNELPPGHVPIQREMVIPVIRDDRIVAILGLGNKAQDFTADDMDVALTFADFAWDIIQNKQADIHLRDNEEKFRTLVNWTYDWELWLDPGGKIVYMSPSCERISGYRAAEFIANPDLMMDIIHSDDRLIMEEHQKMTHDSRADPLTMVYRIIARDGSEHWIEHICRPLFDSSGKHLGRRISNRDITERKLIELQMNDQYRKEQALTQTIQTLQADVGRDLHDTLGNQLSFLRMNLEHLSETQWSDPALVKHQIQQMTKAANESYEMVRAMLAILQMDSLDDPISLFAHYAEQVADRSLFQWDISNQGEPRPLTLQQIRQLYYIFREALGNIEKYASAKKVLGRFIWGAQSMKLEIIDDGIGFDPTTASPPGHYGLKFMRQRAGIMKGALDIQSAPGRGTQITVVVPYEAGPSLQGTTESFSSGKEKR